MSIEERLRQQLTEAMKSKDLQTANVIRMLETKVMERRTAKGFKGEVNDALYVDVIGAYSKSMAKAQKEYEALGERGQEQVAQMKFEVEFCAQFLPQQLGEDEVRAAVKQALTDLGIDGADKDKAKKMSGRVVGSVMKQHKGRVDAGVVKRLVEEAINA